MIIFENSNPKAWYDLIEEFIGANLTEKKLLSEMITSYYKCRQATVSLPKPPTSLYRYFKFDSNGYWIKNIQGFLRLTPPKDWNDLSDSICTAEEYNKLSDEDKKVADIYSHNRYACCFTEQIDYQPHWAYYAGDHSGYAIEYDFSCLNNFAPIPIYYTEKTISFDSIKGLYNAEAKEIKMFPFPMYIKHPNWKHEKEWRLINGKDAKGKYFTDIEDVSPYIKSIIFGVRTNEVFIQSAKQLLSKNKNINFYQMKLNRGTNTITKEPI